MSSESERPLPHGSALVNKVLRGEMRLGALERAKGLKALQLSGIAVADLELIAVGAYTPLAGFMQRADYESVLESMRLQSGTVWPLPITLPVGKEDAEAIHEGDEISLVERDQILGVMDVAEVYPYDKDLEAQSVYRTRDVAHPGVKRIHQQGSYLMGGEIRLVDMPSSSQQEFVEFRHTPAESRRIFARRGWERVVGFQTRNPIHRAHEYIQKTALEIVDGLFLHPLVGETRADDIPVDVRMESYQELLRDYYPADRVVLGVFPAAMRYAGPREALFHAIVRKNYGCTHFIVGRDHAGVGSYYGPYDAQKIFDEFEPEEIGITPLFFENTFFCRKCRGMVSRKTCPHDSSYHLILSGTQVRDMLERGEELPEEFTRPEVSSVLRQGLRTKRDQSKGRRGKS